RADFQYDMDNDTLNALEGGIRFSELEYTSFPRVRDQRTFADAAITGASEACRNDRFPEPGFLSEPSNGHTLITNVDDDGNVISTGTGNTWATFDPLCLVEHFVGSVPNWPSPGRSVLNVDVMEYTTAAYLMAKYQSELMDRPVRGNFGVRVVSTVVESVGLRTTFTTSTNEDGTISISEDSSDFHSVTGGSRYTELLPSASLVMDWDDDILVRVGAFRALSRPDPADLGYGRRLVVDDDDATSITDLVGTANASGNPDLEPLTSWNLDFAVEWYPNPDSILAVGLYYKQFLGGYENAQRVETFTIDGNDFDADVTTSRTDTDSSTITGFEVTFARSFTELPAPFNGLGTKISFNYANSDFEFEDQNFGTSQVLDESGNVVSQRVGIVPPANLFGFSETVLSSQLYYDWQNLDVQLIYKRRGEYFQQFISSPGLVRYVGENEVLEARITYRISKQISVRGEVINLLDEPKTQYIPVQGYLTELNSYGPRMFAGVKIKL
ncbi:MAG: TonB-dependent receptor, partial [Gammaproteobacteria bacterium]|nr:TonB-dependent receptor [Gammaproteobacteria bacterium]